MTAKLKTIGIIGHRKVGRRISGNNINIANRLRQKAICNPRDSAGQASNQGALAKNPLVLHKTAAMTICSLPHHASFSVSTKHPIMKGKAALRQLPRVGQFADVRRVFYIDTFVPLPVVSSNR